MSTNPSAKTISFPLWRTTHLTLSNPEITLVLFASCLILYLLFLPDIAYQPWDSLDYAYSTETIGIVTMRGNHPLGHVIHYLGYAFAGALGYGGRAMFIAQIINGFAGSLAVAVFFWMLAQLLKIKPLIALGCSILLGASFGFWFFTGTADIYTISLLCTVLTWSFFIYEVTLRNRHLPIASGIFAAVSILAHQLNILLIPTGMFLILLTSGRLVPLERKTKQLIAFLSYATLTFMASYILLGFIATSSYSLSRVLGWARGHFSDPTYGRYLSMGHFLTAFDTASQTITTNVQEGNNILRYIVLSVFLFLMLVGLLFNKSLEESWRPVWTLSTLQGLIIWTLILWWEPQNMKFWILSLVPWILSLALAFEALDDRLQDGRFGLHHTLSPVTRAFPALIGTLVFALNFPIISNQHNPQSGHTLAFHRAMDLWIQHSATDDVLITAGDLIPHLLYWGDRPGTVVLYRSLQLSQSSPNDFEELHTRISLALCEHRTIFFTPEAAESLTDDELSLVSIPRENLRALFGEYAQKGQIVFWYENLFNGKRVPVYALTSSGDCVN